MRKLHFVTVFIVLAMAVSLVSPAFALPGLPPVCSGGALQNTTATTTPVSMEFYDLSGTLRHTWNKSGDLAGGATYPFMVSNLLPSTVPDGVYSVIVTSQQVLNSLVNQTACNARTANNPAGDDWIMATHGGVNQASTGTTVYMAYVMSIAYDKRNWSSEIAIQNAGTAVATNVSIAFYHKDMPTGVPILTKSNTSLAPGQTWFLDLSDATLSAELTTASAPNAFFAGAAKITSDQPVAAVSNFAPNYSADYVGSKTPRLLSYNGVTQGSTKLWVPQVAKHAYASVFDSGFTIFNPNPTATTVDIVFTSDKNAADNRTVQKTIPANSVWATHVQAINELPQGFTGGAVFNVTGSSNQIIGIANLDSAIGQALTLNMIRDEEKATTLFYPQITKNAAPGFYGGITLVNTTVTPVDLRITYTNKDGANVFVDDSISLPAKGVKIIFMASVSGVPDGFNGGAKVTIRNGSSFLVGQGNMSIYQAVPDPNIRGDTALTYNVFTP